jgi:para-nitrobenzyl esterase
MTTFRSNFKSVDRRALLAGASALTAMAATPIRAAAGAPEPDPIATTGAGKVRGAVDGGIKVFKGVPYGDTTGGENRFMPPKPRTPWTGVRDALAFGDQCPQAPGNLPAIWTSWAEKQGESEDCLVLNIWTPALRDGKKRPVMVWFHGGGYGSLSGAAAVFDGVHLAQKGDVVVVTLNHRLNLFGYMDMRQYGPQYANSANLGQQDLVAALRWVRDNITEFGGDPGNVMIFGESGGGGKVCTTMAMPAAHGLFHRAAVQSGPGLRAQTPEVAAANAKKMMDQLGIAPGDRGFDPQAVPTQFLISALEKVGVGLYAPVIDPLTLPTNPFDPTASPVSADVPLIIGYNKTETTVLGGTPDQFNATWDTLPGLLKTAMRGADPTAVIAAMRTEEPKANAADLYFRITTERGMGAGSHLIAQRRVEAKQAPTYVYRLEWETPVDGGKWRTPHALDLTMIFDNVANSASLMGNGSAEAQHVADAMSAAWINFARKGDPNGGKAPHWDRYELTTQPVLVFDTHSHMTSDAKGGAFKVVSEATKT